MFCQSWSNFGIILSARPYFCRLRPLMMQNGFNWNQDVQFAPEMHSLSQQQCQPKKKCLKWESFTFNFLHWEIGDQGWFVVSNNAKGWHDIRLGSTCAAACNSDWVSGIIGKCFKCATFAQAGHWNILKTGWNSAKHLLGRHQKLTPCQCHCSFVQEISVCQKRPLLIIPRAVGTFQYQKFPELKWDTS